MYNALHDSQYRAVWDRQMLSSRTICIIDADNDVGYYEGVSFDRLSLPKCVQYSVGKSGSVIACIRNSADFSYARVSFTVHHFPN